MRFEKGRSGNPGGRPKGHGKIRIPTRPLFTRTLAPATVAVVTLIWLLVSSHVQASSCINEIVVPIQFNIGASCWVHDGRGTTFVGRFAAGQHVLATAAGEAFFGDGHSNWTKIEPWTVDVSGPGGFIQVSPLDGGPLDATLPVTGKYRFGVGPCAIWGNQGMIAICTLQ
jgi:hypothetical protein